MPASNSEEMDFISRPKNQLLDYPTELRWEVTRRHPYYLAFWKLVQQFYENPISDDSERWQYGFAAKLALEQIGVSGEPIAPETPFEQISGDPTFLCGSLQPLTFRAITSMLLGQLNPETQQFIGEILIRNATICRDQEITTEICQAQQMGLRLALRVATQPELNCVPGSPVFFMHLDASQETIKEDANRQANLWKKKLERKSPKTQTSKIADYLVVWDAIEGWINGHYDFQQEHTFKQLANKTNKPLSTIHEQYKRAFATIVGHNFSPLLWRKVMGRFKISLVTETQTATYHRLLRRMNNPNRRDPKVKEVSETTVNKFTESKDTVSGTQSALDNSVETFDLADNIMERLANGQTDEQIIHAFDWTDKPKLHDLLKQLRTKCIDLSKLIREQ